MTEQARGFCRFCIALCGIRVTTDGDRVVAVLALTDAEVGQLEGGSLVEAITFRRIHPRIQEWVTLVSGALLLSLMAFVFLNDIRGLSGPRPAMKRSVEPTNGPKASPSTPASPKP